MRNTLLLALFIFGCTHKSELKSEGGIVVEKQYFPDTRQTVSGTGFTSNGKIVLTSHSIGKDEQYIVIFKCDHGVVFSINRADLYGKLQKDDKVRIDYREVLWDKDNSLYDLDFEDANKLN